MLLRARGLGLRGVGFRTWGLESRAYSGTSSGNWLSGIPTQRGRVDDPHGW